jgi:hypothetical protein
MISLDRNPCFAERNRLSAKASRLRLRVTAESASPRAAAPQRRVFAMPSEFGPCGRSALEVSVKE